MGWWGGNAPTRQAGPRQSRKTPQRYELETEEAGESVIFIARLDTQVGQLNRITNGPGVLYIKVKLCAI